MQSKPASQPASPTTLSLGHWVTGVVAVAIGGDSKTFVNFRDFCDSDLSPCKCDVSSCCSVASFVFHQCLRMTTIIIIMTFRRLFPCPNFAGCRVTRFRGSNNESKPLTKMTTAAKHIWYSESSTLHVHVYVVFWGQPAIGAIAFRFRLYCTTCWQ